MWSIIASGSLESFIGYSLLYTGHESYRMFLTDVVVTFLLNINC